MTVLAVLVTVVSLPHVHRGSNTHLSAGVLDAGVLHAPPNRAALNEIYVEDRVTTTAVIEHATPPAATRGTPRQHVAPLVTAPPAPKVVVASSIGGAWACIREHESGGNYADNTGNGYYGAYQFSLTTWRSTMTRLGYGNTYPRADLAPPAIQDQAAINLQSVAGWGQWPRTSRICGLR